MSFCLRLYANAHHIQCSVEFIIVQYSLLLPEPQNIIHFFLTSQITVHQHILVEKNEITENDLRNYKKGIFQFSYENAL